ncbi:MAG: transcriptional regulator [Anaerolineaceae bacterium]|nr:transcriptional regulator [Anaerolineaceae bacterium]
MTTSSRNEESLNPVEKIDKLIHEPSRLLILANLYVVKRADYTYMMRQTGLSMSNISVHLSKLENAGFVDIIKEFKGKKPYTMMALTDLGREAFDNYRANLAEVFEKLDD